MTAKECINQLMSSNPFMRGCRNIDKFNDYMNSLLELLEKQIPKEPINNVEYPSCPICDHAFYWGCIDKYCTECGQAIKWE